MYERAYPGGAFKGGWGYGRAQSGVGASQTPPSGERISAGSSRHQLMPQKVSRVHLTARLAVTRSH